MDIDFLLSVAKNCHAGAVLAGYGFISENADAVDAFEREGIIWLGPSAEVIRRFGLKHAARQVAEAAGVPVVPGSGVIAGGVEEAMREANKVGYPVLVKASAGGGGMGQTVVRNDNAMRRAFEGVVQQSLSLFGSGDVYLEKYVEHARHVEVQVFGNGKQTVALGVRECSVQRRRQKVVEEGGVGVAVIDGMREAAVRLCEEVGYASAGTVEFLVDADEGGWWFLEVNTRLQVEHAVTELVTRVDIVDMMIRLGGGEDVLEGWQGATERGVAIQARVYAENPVKGYLPCAGVLSEMVWPEEGPTERGGIIRVDGWAQKGTVVPGNYDPLLGKVLAWGKTRALALMELKRVLNQVVVRGVPSNVELLLQVMEHPAFLTARYTTGLLDSFAARTNAVEVVKPGLQSSLQDYPGRVGYWDIGVSPSGPMDAYAMGMANALVGNSLGACALEMTMTGPTLVFHTDAVVALTGGRFQAELDDGKQVPYWTPFKLEAGSTLTIGQLLSNAPRQEGDTEGHEAGGKIAYLAVRGGFDAPKYLGSASTFPTGNFGGLSGSFLVTGDFLPIAENTKPSYDEAERNGLDFRWPLGKQLLRAFIPSYTSSEWVVGALNGPHASEDFLREETLEGIWTTSYEVHHATNRLGARLIGPAPKWTRNDGGSAGLHPSNLHDYTYAPGAVNFSGNTPIVLMLDGPSLGGFVCPITVASAELWKVAQARPGEKIMFKQVDYDGATSGFLNMEAAWEAVQNNDIDTLEQIAAKWSPQWAMSYPKKNVQAVLSSLDPARGDEAEIKVQYRMSGDEHVLIEYGDIELDLEYRLRVHMLMEELKPRQYVKELCPGVRSLLVRYARKLIHVEELVRVFRELESGVLGSVENVQVPSRVVNLPLSFNDKWTVEAQGRYLRSVRPDAPYMPSNVEFVRRINGLESVNDVKDIMTAAEYMVLGLGDVYLGAPCAVPVDPRHRLVTSKYNPARTYTPEGAVGIGGAYMCIYGMDSPGGYQLTGRTLPIWDNYGSIPEENRGAPKDVPWLLRYFDRVKFFPVSDEQLEDLRSQYRKGNYKIDIVEETFCYKEYVDFCRRNKKSIENFEQQRDSAYKAERERWQAEGEEGSNAAAEHARTGVGTSTAVEGDTGKSRVERPPFSMSVPAGMSASVWAVHVQNGDVVEKGAPLFALESMKVEITIEAPVPGTVEWLSVSRGDGVSPDQELCIIVSNENTAASDATIDQLRELYKLGICSPEQVISSAMKSAGETEGVFATLSSQSACDRRIQEAKTAKEGNKYTPLYGIPFVVADDIEVQGTTAHSCTPGLAYESTVSAPIVQALESAGAIFLGKTTTDQLNVGNTGIEVSTQPIENPAYKGFVTGGNGAAAVAVYKQIASFAITVDRNGSASIAPALCGVMGLRISEGLLPMSDSTTVCSTVDSLTIYANNAADLKRVFNVCVAAREAHMSKIRVVPKQIAPSPFERVKVGVCNFEGYKRIVGDEASAFAYEQVVDGLKQMGYSTREKEMGVFTEVSSVQDEVPIHLSRLHHIVDAVRRNKASVLSSVSERLLAVDKISASAFGKALADLHGLKRKADLEIWSEVDVVVLPAFSRAYKVEEAKSRDVERVNLGLSRMAQVLSPMDLCCVVVDLHLSQEMPRGIFIAAPAFREQMLLEIASHW